MAEKVDSFQKRKDDGELELTFEISAQWTGIGRQGEGEMTLGAGSIPYSAPATMGGKGVGTSPEEFLLAAVTSCYSGTLMRVLHQAELPGVTVEIKTEGQVTEYPEHARFSRITVHPTIKGGDVARQLEYEEACQVARERCFIGRTVRDYLDYTVGKVTVA